MVVLDKIQAFAAAVLRTIVRGMDARAEAIMSPGKRP